MLTENLLTVTKFIRLARSTFCQSASFSIVGLSIFACAIICGISAQAKSPNIIFILADDLGYGDLGCYGQELIQTPRLDQMAKEGIRFTNFYAGNTVCAPSRAVLMTGLHMGHTQVRGNAGGPDMSKQSLRDEDVTVPEMLKPAGYTSALCGKWGLGDDAQGGKSGLPRSQGFDFFYGYLNQVHAHNYFPSSFGETRRKEPLNNVVQRAEMKYGGFAEDGQQRGSTIVTILSPTNH